MSESWLTRAEWDLLYQLFRPNSLTKDEFVDELIINGGKYYKKVEMEKIIKNLREICSARGKFTAQYELDSSLQRYGGRGPGYCQGVLKEGLGLVIKKFITTPIDEIGMMTRKDDDENSNNNNNNNNNITDNDDEGSNISKPSAKGKKTTKLSGTRRTREEDDDGGASPEKEHGAQRNSDALSFPRLSRGSASPTITNQAAGTRKDSTTTKVAQQHQQQSPPATSTKKSHQPTNDRNNNEDHDDDGDTKPHRQQDVGGMNNQHQQKDDTAELNPYHSVFHVNQLLSTFPQLVKDMKTRLQKYNLPHNESKILEAICKGSHTDTHAPDFSIQAAAYLPYRSPLLDIRAVLHRTSIHYGLSSPIIFKTPSLTFNKAQGDRVMLVALKPAFHDKKGRSVVSYEPMRWPQPPQETLKLMVNDQRINVNFRRNWPKSRRSDISADTPIKTTYLPLDITPFVLQGGSSQTLRYEMASRDIQLDLAILVTRQIPADLLVGNFMRSLCTDRSKLEGPQRLALRRLYCGLLGISSSHYHSNNINTKKEHNDDDQDDDDDADLVEGDPTMNLRCPIGYCTINIPVRGRRCDHLQCVDLRNHIATCNGQCFWSCSICDRPMAIDDIIWDPLQHRLLKQCLTRNAKFDSGGTTFALKKKQDQTAYEEVIGGVAAEYQYYDPNFNKNNNKNDDDDSSSSDDDDNNNNNGSGDYGSSYYKSKNSINNNKKKVVSLDSEDESMSEPPTSTRTGGSSSRNNFTNNNNTNRTMTTSSQNAYLGLMGLGSGTSSNNNNNNSGVHQSILQNRDKQIRRQESQFTRKTPHAQVAVQGNSKDDAIELD